MRTRAGFSFILTAAMAIVLSTACRASLDREAQLSIPAVDDPQNIPKIQNWCDEVGKEIKRLAWHIDPCGSIPWRNGGTSFKGRPLVYAEFGKPSASNTTLVFTMVHGDETSAFYLGIQLAHWLQEHQNDLGDSRVVVAPLVNPDGFFRKPKTRTNGQGVDLNRNFATADWDSKALQTWKKTYRSHPRRYPGPHARSESETIFQEDLIRIKKPQKILSVHAPLNFMDYDGPTVLSLARFPKEYVQECLKLRKQLKAVTSGFFPGSLGNYAGQQLGIPTLTLELPTSNANHARGYWDHFKMGIRTMIEFHVPDISTVMTASKPSGGS